MACGAKGPLTGISRSVGLHGRSGNSRGGVLAIPMKDPDTHKLLVEEYLSHWTPAVDKQQAQIDRLVCIYQSRVTSKLGADGNQTRKASYATITKQYYDLVTDIYEHTLGTHFHFCCIRPGVPLSVAVSAHEQLLVEQLGLQDGQRVVDIGCGVGGPAREIARNASVAVVGVNISEYQLQRATRYTTAANLQDQVTFHRADFMHTGLDSDSFDAAYSIEGTSYAPSLQGVYSEIFRILKPGGSFAAYELILTDIYDNDNPEHRKIRHALEEGMGITNLSTMSEAIEAMKAAGFELKSAEDLASSPDQIPWHYLLTGSLRVINSIWDIRRLIHMAFLRSDVARGIVGACELAGILPPGSQKIIDTLARVGDMLVKAGDMKLFTPMFLIAGKKPLEELTVKIPFA